MYVLSQCNEGNIPENYRKRGGKRILEPQTVVVAAVQLCLTFCNPMDCSTPGFPVLHHLPELVQIHVHWVSDAINHLILCHLPLLPAICPSITVFSNDSALLIRWPKYWSFSFSISLLMNNQDWFPLGWTDLISL